MIALAPLLLALQPLPRGPTPTRATQPAVPALFSKGAAAAAAAAVAASPLPAFANQAAAVAEAADTDGGLPIVGKFFETEEGRQVLVYLAQTVINWGVPASVALVFVLLTFKPPKSPEDGDEPPLPPQLAKALGLSKEPKEYLKIERLNAKLASFDYSFQKATVSKESALRASERQALERRFGAEVADMTLDSETVRAIAKAEEKFRKVDGQIAKDLEQATRKLRASSLSKKGNATAAAAGKADDEAEGGGGPMGLVKGMMPAGMMSGFANGELQKQVRMLQDKRLNNELAFLSALSAKLQPEQASKLAMALKPPASDLNADEPGGGSPSAVVALAGAAAATRAEAKHVYVLSFFGDVTASQVSTLRQEVTAVLRTVNVSRGDEVVLVLNTGGGTVTGYGLAAAQLGRLKNADVPLTICVEQVAASGGYMMACVADKILCAPFAVIGSIGVITEQPNVYERLKKEGVVFSTVTAGKYKRTLTPTKQLDPKDMAKLKDDIEQVLTLFKGFVAENRPQLDIATVAPAC